MTKRQYQTFREFFPYYLREHAAVHTRMLHYMGTALVILVFVTAIVTMNPMWLLGMPLGGYFFAWVAHVFVEKNRPATFTYPVWSLVADFKMFFLAISGRLPPHLVRAGVPLNS